MTDNDTTAAVAEQNHVKEDLTAEVTPLREKLNQLRAKIQGHYSDASINEETGPNESFKNYIEWVTDVYAELLGDFVMDQLVVNIPSELIGSVIANKARRLKNQKKAANVAAGVVPGTTSVH